MEIPSKYLNDCVQVLSKLPGIGKKTALRLALHILKQDVQFTTQFCNAILQMKTQLKFCKNCNFLSDGDFCNICSDTFRKKDLICVVESIREVIAIENTQQYSGLYHVLGGLISPLDGIGPEQLNIQALVDRIKLHVPEEIIFALSPNIQGDTTIYYMQQQLQGFACKITTISRGVSFGGNIEFVDEFTLARSILNRQPPQHYIQ
ncbi:MAG: recombination mediator RecR [Alphaproteobacteria bacterium]|nr:recombination mediator RecR [Alphaproteobacteria bacterium]